MKLLIHHPTKFSSISTSRAIQMHTRTTLLIKHLQIHEWKKGTLNKDGYMHHWKQFHGLVVWCCTFFGQKGSPINYICTLGNYKSKAWTAEKLSVNLLDKQLPLKGLNLNIKSMTICNNTWSAQLISSGTRRTLLMGHQQQETVVVPSLHIDEAFPNRTQPHLQSMQRLFY